MNQRGRAPVASQQVGSGVPLQLAGCAVLCCAVLRCARRAWARSLAPDPSLCRLLPTADGRLLLASASQDKCVRVWAIRLQEPTSGSSSGSGSGGGEEGGGGAAALSQLIARYAPQPRLATPSHSYSATLEALLVGHEDWVHSVAWQQHAQRAQQAANSSAPAAEGSGQQGRPAPQPPCLLSASMDRTMMVWKPDRATGERRGGGASCLAALRCLLAPLLLRILCTRGQCSLPSLRSGGLRVALPAPTRPPACLPARLLACIVRSSARTLPVARAVKSDARATLAPGPSVTGRRCSPSAGAALLPGVTLLVPPTLPSLPQGSLRAKFPTSPSCRPVAWPPPD